LGSSEGEGKGGKIFFQVRRRSEILYAQLNGFPNFYAFSVLQRVMNTCNFQKAADTAI
jgi:hypothetical protein